jgi:beta-galactosidase
MPTRINRLDSTVTNRLRASRREFLHQCAIGAGGIAAWSLVGDKMLASPGIANLPSGPTARTYSLDRNWLFGGAYGGSTTNVVLEDQACEKITLPHCVSHLSWQNWDFNTWEKVWIYRRHFRVPEESTGSRVFLKFDGVMVAITPIINGHVFPQHMGGYLPARYEITDHLNKTGNQLDVVVDSRWCNVPPEGSPEGPGNVDYLQPGGIFRSVHLEVLPQNFISDVFAKPVNVLNSNRTIEVRCLIDSSNIPAGRTTIRIDLRDENGVFSQVEDVVLIEKTGTTEAKLTLSNLGNIKFWDPDAPRLYNVVATLLVNGTPVHDYRVRVGLRDARFELDGFFLNGQRLQLFGLNRHELYPYVGFAMPRRVMRRDAEILHNEFNCNVVRCSHYPQSEDFLEACDELGLMVWEEVPGWGYLGDEAWKELLVRDVRDMVVRDRNHPSIIIWGVRVNESPNDQPLYRRTTELAKSLDDSRPTSGSMTGGSRKNWEQEWHQDVFAFDNYSATPDRHVKIDEPVPGVPYMLAEAVGQFNYKNGKGFDNKYRRAGDVELQQQQALWHAEAHDKAAANPRICGVIAWCGFDYASLINSYNNIKCPGVADVFRIPKLGASFYQAQVNPNIRVVIHPNFYWDFGTKSPNGPGDHAAIFSNCERLELFLDGQHYATLHPDVAQFPHLKHPPFFANLEIKNADHPELRIDGYVGDKLALSKLFSSDISNDQFLVSTDDAELMGDGIDATRLVVKVTDKYGEARLFAGGVVTFEVTGPGLLVGDNPFHLTENGGLGSVWIKAQQDGSGRIVVAATHATLGTRSVEISVRLATSDPTYL